MKISGQTTRNGQLGASQNLLLGILAALIALLGYLYFFTGVIKERDVQQNSATDAVRVVKQPIPPRPAGSDVEQAKSVSKGEPKPQPAAVPAGAAKAQAPSAPAAPPAAVPAAVAPKPPVVTAKAPPKPARPAEQQPSPKPTATVVPPPPKQPETRIVKHQAKISEPEKKVKKTVDAKPLPAKPVSPGGYRIVTSAIPSPVKADSVLATMKKGGLTKIEKKQLTEEKVMKRLFVAEFGDSQSAHVELDKVKKFSAGSFLIPESGRFFLYAGSYDQDRRAHEEVKRLSGKGMNVTVKTAKLKIPVTRITAVAHDKNSADEWLQRLSKLGVPSEKQKVDR